VLGGLPAVGGILLAQVLGPEFVVPIGVHLHTNIFAVVAGYGVLVKYLRRIRYRSGSKRPNIKRSCLRPDLVSNSFFRRGIGKQENVGMVGTVFTRHVPYSTRYCTNNRL
jgi:hypothetical protein